jgi:hypothetical protein
VRSSNAGHCLFTEIARQDRAQVLAKTFLAIRTPWPEFSRECSTSVTSLNSIACRNCSAGFRADLTKGRRCTRWPVRHRRGPPGPCFSFCKPASGCRSKFLHRVEMRDLEVGNASVDLVLTRQARDVTIHLSQRTGKVKIVSIR